MPFFVSFLFLTLFFSVCFLLFCPCFPLFLSYLFPLLPTKWLAALEQCSRAPALCRTLFTYVCVFNVMSICVCVSVRACVCAWACARLV